MGKTQIQNKLNKNKHDQNLVELINTNKKTNQVSEKLILLY